VTLASDARIGGADWRSMVNQTPPAAQPPVLFDEALGMPRQAWALFGLALVVALVVVHPYTVPLVALSWLYSVMRFHRVRVRVDPWYLSVGKRHAPLAGLDLTTLGRARNPWPWKVFSRSYLGANPIWTSDSVRVIGRDLHGGQVTVAVGTNRRDELLGVLESAVARASTALGAQPATEAQVPSPAASAAPVNASAAPAGSAPVPAGAWPAPSSAGWTPQPPVRPPAPGWYDDPWAPGASWRWWDGRAWTSYCAPAYGRWGVR